MRTILAETIEKAVAKLSMDACYFLGEDVYCALKHSIEREKSPTGRDILGQLVQNAEIAREEEVAICQDCGLAVIFAEVGQDVHIEGDFEQAVNDGVIMGYEDGYLRKSTCTPFTRKNYGNNAPAILHVRLVPGDQIKLTLAPKGGGSENMSAMKMFAPAVGRKGVVDFVVGTVRAAGPNPCPPIVVGVGIGGNFEKAPLLAKQALLREIGSINEDETMAQLEQELLERINALGIGPGGLGGTTTALAVHVESAPCHIASLPVAVNLNCHAARHKTVVL
ncbi:MAG TPA: fumarate hydratase [Firmicutes bacterium]|nr:fumarate hydratase [Bacillota bacterium]